MSTAIAAAPAALDKHEGICDPRAHGGCQRWPEHLRFLNETTGEVVLGRCRATNLCEYCRTLYVVETVEMLTLDALENAPTIWVVLTAREHLTRKDTYDHLRQLRKAARLRWPNVEWFVQVEFQRRGALHLNLLVKGVPAREVDELHRVLVERWCARVDAAPVGQWSEAIECGISVTKYISKMLAHGLKTEQAPPIGWKGHRTSQTRGYLVRPASVMREEARASLRVKRRLYKAIREAEEIVGGGAAPSDLVEQLFEQREAEEASSSWRLARVRVGVKLDRGRRHWDRRPYEKQLTLWRRDEERRMRAGRRNSGAGSRRTWQAPNLDYWNVSTPRRSLPENESDDTPAFSRL